MEKDRLMGSLILLFLLVIFVFLEILAIESESLTWDEIGHYKEGLAAISYDIFNISPNSPTFIPQLAALPTVFGFDDNQLFFPRITIVLLTVLLAVGIYFFALSFFDIKTGLAAVFLFLFEPLIFANVHYTTLDTGFSLLFFLAYWLLVLFMERGSFLMGIFAGFSLGLALAAKVTAVGFLAIIFFILAIFKRENFKRNLSKGYWIVFCIFILAGIWFTYRFTFGNLGGFTEGDFRLSNKIYFKLEKFNPLLADYFKKAMSLPLPLGDFPRIFKNALVFNLTPKTSFFMGGMRESSGFLMLTLFVLKTPLPLLILLILGLTSFWRGRGAIFIIPLMAVFIFVFLAKMDLRLRYLMPVYPFLAIIGAYGLRKAWTYFLLVWFLISFIKSFPHTISYANEVSLFFGKPYLIFSDSNIDWGQGLIALKKYAEKNNIGKVNLSYYGTDDPNKYGFRGFIKDNVCKKACLIDKTYTNFLLREKEITAISITNWQECGFYQNEKYLPDRIKAVVGGSILVFENKM